MTSLFLMSAKKEMVKVCLNGKTKLKKFALIEPLANVRQSLGNDVFEYVFVSEDVDIDLDQEEEFVIEDIIKDGIIYMKPKSKEETIQESQIKELPKNTPIAGSRYLYDLENLKIYEYPKIEFSNLEETQALCMIVVGQTGSGKTTLLNSFVNAIVGVLYEDDFRYIIIQEDVRENTQAVSQTSEVNIYKIASHNGNPPIKIIDTPGFGDTRGFTEDENITKKIEEQFRSQVKTINAICFVVQASNVRLTSNQQYIFKSIIDMFGNDVAENFVAMITFCDGKTPPVLTSLKAEGSIFDKIIPQIKPPWYLQFNNSAIFSSNDNPINKMFWNIGMMSFQNFIDKFKTLPAKSLQLSVQVLSKRQNLQISLQNLHKKLKVGLDEINSLRDILEQIQKHKKTIDSSKNFRCTKTKKVENPPGVMCTLCNQCNTVCHYPCNVVDKKYCGAMSGEYCTECHGHCHHALHININFHWEDEEKIETYTDTDLEKQFNAGRSDLSRSDNIKLGILDRLKSIFSECISIQEQIKNYLIELSNIALNPIVITSVEYIEVLIRTENEKHQPGWEKRIEGLNQMKETQKLIEAIKQNKNLSPEYFEQEKNRIISGQYNKLLEKSKTGRLEDLLTDCNIC